MADTEQKIQWHPGFYGAAELELIENKGQLQFIREHNLSKAPLQVDLLVIKKLSDVPIANEIGHIFKRYNIIEYKSPEDGLTIDDYYKTVGYACLYKGLSQSVNAIPAGELTVTLVRERYPRRLFEALRENGLEVEQRYPGVYYLHGNTLFPAQVIVSGQLTPEAHWSLRALSVNLTEEDARRFVNTAVTLREPGDKNNVDAVLQVSVNANRNLYEAIRRGEIMCQALIELFQEEYDTGVARGRAEGRAEGRTEGRTEGLAEGLLLAVRNMMQNAGFTLEQALKTMNIPTVEWPRFKAQLESAQ